MGKWGITGLALVLIGAALWLAARWVLAHHGVAVLDWADRQFGGNRGYRVAVADGHYGPDAAQRIEVIVPAQNSARPLPVIVFIHGGSWNSGDPRDYRFIGRQLARRGYVVINAGYRLGQPGRFPAMLEDGAAALAWVQRNVTRFGGDPAGVCLMGHSAGAYNAAMLVLERQWLGRAGLPDGFVRGFIGLSGPYDFYPFTSDSTRAAFGSQADPAITQPITFVRGDASPMLLLTGDRDTTVKPRNSLALGKALEQAGGTVQVVVIEGLDHTATIKLLAAPFNRDTRVLDPVLHFLSAHCRASSPVQPDNR